MTEKLTDVKENCTNQTVSLYNGKISVDLTLILPLILLFMEKYNRLGYILPKIKTNEH